MIRIICDFEHIEAYPADYVVQTPTDYIPVRRAIHKHLNGEHASTVLRVVVQHPIVAEWLADLRDYGDQVVDWQITSIRQRFIECFGVNPPNTLSPKTIVKYNILSWPRTKLDTENIEGSILGHLISQVWFPEIPEHDHLREFVAWTIESTTPDALLMPLMQHKLNQWIKANEHYGAFDTLGNLRERSQQLIARWVFRDYPPQFIEQVGLNNINLIDLNDWSAPTQAIHYYEKEIKRFWRCHFTEFELPREAVQDALNRMSGVSKAELEVLSDYVMQHPESADFSLIRAVQSKFYTLPTLDKVTARLQTSIPLESPAIPVLSSGVEEMLSWVCDKYMPYFKWCVQHNQDRASQILLSQHFAEWLYKNYAQFLFDADSPIVCNQSRRFIDDVGLNRVVLWVIVDGLTWWEGEKLVQLAPDHNLNVHEMKPYVSALPSITSVSKRAMVRGYLEAAIDGEMSNVRISQEELRKRYSASDATTDVREWHKALQNENTGVYLWFYNELDEYHHNDHSSEILDHVVEGHLKQVLRHIDEAIQQCHQNGIGVTVFISSDHGCTYLPSNIGRVNLPKFASEWRKDEPQLDTTATRTCAILGEVKPLELDRLENEWFVLDKHRFNLPMTFISPKSYQYIGKRPKGWTHGGLSPEEVVVPFIQFQTDPLTILELRVEIVGQIQANRAGQMQVTVTNPNVFELRNVILSFRWTEEVLLSFGALPASRKSSLEIDLPARSISGNHIMLDYLVTYEVHKQEKRDKGRVDLPVRRFMTSAMDDLF